MLSFLEKKKALFCFLLPVALSFSVTGCDMDEQVYAEPVDYVDSRLVEANTAFAFNLFQALLEEEPTGKNIIISPASVSLALAMTYNGARGETAEAMEEVLQFYDLNREDLNAAFYDLRTILQNPDPRAELAIANSLWVRRGVDLNDTFIKANKDYFAAKVSELDFDIPGAAGEINSWVEEETKGRIKDLIDSTIDHLTALFLINAIYFQADWSESFDEKQTREIPFNIADRTSKDHPVMFREGEYRYLEGDGFQAVAIPYGKNERLSMYVFLPDNGVTLERFCEGFNAGAWNDWLNSFQKIEGQLGLPRFQFEYESSLNSVLKSLGMEIAFDEGLADFSGIRPAPPNLYVSEVKHKAFVEVNEKGTEAAAATSVEMKFTSAPLDWFSMTVDRPFFFSIVDDQTGAILFMGSVAEPL